MRCWTNEAAFSSRHTHETTSSERVDASILAVQQASSRPTSEANPPNISNLTKSRFFSQRESTLLSLAAIIAQGTGNDLLRRETTISLDAGLSETDVQELPKLLGKTIGAAASAQADTAITEALSQRNSDRRLKRQEGVADRIFCCVGRRSFQPRRSAGPQEAPIRYKVRGESWRWVRLVDQTAYLLEQLSSSFVSRRGMRLLH